MLNLNLGTVAIPSVNPMLIQGYKGLLVAGAVYGGIQGLCQWWNWVNRRERITLEKNDELLGGITNVGYDTCRLLYYGSMNMAICTFITGTFPASTFGVMYIYAPSQQLSIKANDDESETDGDVENTYQDTTTYEDASEHMETTGDSDNQSVMSFSTFKHTTQTTSE